jgi:CHAD domain-containing protein
MAYRFKQNEAISHAVQRVFAEEIAWAVGQLVRSKKRTEAVHEARKSIKKIRGLLSLLGPGYKSQDRYFRDVGRLLSDSRDNTVVLQVFDALTAKQPVVSEIRDNLRRSFRQGPTEKNLSADVAQLLRHAPPLVAENLQFESLLPAMDETYRQGRKAWKRAHREHSAEALHNFRKQVKQHLYHLRLMENDAVAKRIDDLHALETWLGDHHNLTVLRDRLKADVETSHDRKRILPLIALIDDESHALRNRALEAGEQLYGEKAMPIRKPPVSAVALRTVAAIA